MTTDWHNDPATPPNLKDVETGRFFQPVYPNGITTFEVKTAEWKHVSRATFGPARGTRNGSGGWTGNSHRYDIYRYAGTDIFNERAWAVRYSHGGGQGWFLYRPLSGKTTPMEHAVSLPEPQRWDVCNFLCESVERTATEAARDEFNRIAHAFAQGRLRKRKIRGTDKYRITVEPKPIQVQA